MTKILIAQDVSKVFGGLTAVEKVNISIEKGQIAALIGPNGAGKTTFFNALTGVAPATTGKVLFNPNGTEIDITKTGPGKIAKMGIVRTFQNIRLFDQMTVSENIKIALTKNYRESFLDTILRTPKFMKEEERVEDWTNDFLKKFDLYDVKDVQATNLAYGMQRRVEIARAVATEPKVIFLDEPAAGMNPEETNELSKLIKRLQTEFGLTVVLIEHDMSLVMNLAEKIYVLNHGKLIAEGSAADIQADDAVIEAYLGGEHHVKSR